MSRDPEELGLEAEYWQALLAELAELESLFPTCAEAIASGAIGILEVAAGPLTSGQGAGLDRLQHKLHDAVTAIPKMQARTGAIMRLVDGRLDRLYAEAGLDRPGREPF